MPSPNPDALLNLARQDLSDGRLAAAQDKCLQVLTAHHHHPGALVLLGEALSGQGRHEEAVRVFNALTLMQPAVADLEDVPLVELQVVADHRNAPVNALGYLRVMFAVTDIDELLDRLLKRGAQLVGEVVLCENSYRLCYIRGPDGILIGLAEQLELNK